MGRRGRRADQELAGIYLHIPFCRQACNYCNFHFTTSLRNREELVRAVLKEAEESADYLHRAEIETIYFGGGTPSLLPTSDVQLILDHLRSLYPVADDAEITLEANPDDIDSDQLRAWKDAGVNRLSIGIQSFAEEELRWMNRAHHAGQARDCIEKSLDAGFDNMSIDLIYGSPLLTDEGWMKNMEIATGYGIPHLSCYALTVEEKTPLQKQIAGKKLPDVDPDKQARQFLMLMEHLGNQGYEHYEVSNFAKPGKRSRHNSSYWKGVPYVGLGPSAHSFNGRERRWNVANNQVYIRSVQEGNPERGAEELTEEQRLNETVMISLRTMEGLNLEKIETDFGKKEAERLAKGLIIFDGNGLVKMNGGIAVLTDEGMLRADGIAASLFK
jgi:oxygen-independent coproporphyrinogen-3 oxidase